MEGDPSAVANQDPTAWDVLSLGLTIGASAVAVLGAALGLWQLIKRWWNRSFGRRRAQAQILDQLACTLSMKFAESLLGVPLLILHPYGTNLREERHYRLPGGWVSIEPKDGAVYLFSITITDPKMYYDITDMTGGLFKIKLGQDTFAQARHPEHGDLHDGEHLWMSVRQAGYIRHHYLANSSAYQNYWLSFNAAGGGRFAESWSPYAAGIYGDHGDSPPDPATITVNTLTVSFGGNDDETKLRDLFGPNVDHNRIFWAARRLMPRPPPGREL